MARNDGIDFRELDRQRKARGAEFSLEETAQAGVRRVRRAGHPLDYWFARNILDQRQYDAGCWLRDTCEQAERSPPSSAYDGVPPPDHFGSSSVTDNQVVASRKLEAARNHMGAMVYRDLEAFCARGFKPNGSWFEAGKWQGRIGAALHILADYRGM